MRIRQYSDHDMEAMIRIWNEVVTEGIAFPQEDCLDMTVIFFGTITICAVFGSQPGLIRRIMLLYMFLFTLYEWEEREGV